MNMFSYKLLINFCSVPTCQKEIGLFEVLCPRHWRDVPPVIKEWFGERFDRMEYDQRLEPPEAWRRTVEKWGIIDASMRLDQYNSALQAVLSQVLDRQLERYVELIKGDKWKTNK
jgi:hypothetical protein